MKTYCNQKLKNLRKRDFKSSMESRKNIESQKKWVLSRCQKLAAWEVQTKCGCLGVCK